MDRRRMLIATVARLQLNRSSGLWSLLHFYGGSLDSTGSLLKVKVSLKDDPHIYWNIASDEGILLLPKHKNIMSICTQIDLCVGACTERETDRFHDFHPKCIAV
ncbi:uncharacterized protein LOC107304958 [Oryza brachyantha]|uniref:uncharacterized protein LOC107304958 n=1 Tax=Oryza brachyantha TaxID=4533 RepID=UPI0007760A7D|nr:uncharacterized protein LOC107304958 [Oryza brachyantha]